MAELEEQDLMFDRVTSGDRPSLFALGLWGAESLKKANIAIFMVDALGRVQCMPPASVQILSSPRVEETLLDKLEVETAIQVLVAQGDQDGDILEYIKRRKGREAANGAEGL